MTESSSLLDFMGSGVLTKRRGKIMGHRNERLAGPGQADQVLLTVELSGADESIGFNDYHLGCSMTKHETKIVLSKTLKLGEAEDVQVIAYFDRKAEVIQIPLSGVEVAFFPGIHLEVVVDQSHRLKSVKVAERKEGLDQY